MNTPEEVLLHVIEKLDESGIPYMIGGSFAGNLYGLPRATQDADMVVELRAEAVEALRTALSDAFYFDADSARTAIRYWSMFNIIHRATGFKIDLIVKKKRAFSQEEFRRRRQAMFAGKMCWFVSPEDTILSKLEWSMKGESEWQYRDAAGIAKVQKGFLDLTYLHKWAAVLGVTTLLTRILQEEESR